MYLPQITSYEEAGLYKLGDYLCILGTDCESIANSPMYIIYLHILLVLDSNTNRPIYAVAAETNSNIQEQIEKGEYEGDAVALGVFPGNGHANLGFDNAHADLTTFTQKALDVVRDHFKLTVLPQQLPHRPGHRVQVMSPPPGQQIKTVRPPGASPGGSNDKGGPLQNFFDRWRNPKH